MSSREAHPYSAVGKDEIQYRNAEWPLAGITVTLYGPGGVLDTTTTGPDGSYLFEVNLANGTPVIVEWSNWPAGYHPGPVGPDNLSSVMHTAVGECNADFTLSRPVDHCPDDPDLAIACFVGQDTANGSGTGPTDVLVSLDYTQGTPFVATEDDPECCDPAHTSGSYTANEEYMNAIPSSTGPSPEKRTLADWTDIGTVYGVAVDRRRERVFSSAFFRLYTLEGPAGYGAIYVDDSLWVDLATDLGMTVERFDGQPNIPDNNVGYTGLGDLEINDDDSELFTINLATQEIVAIPVLQNGAPDTTNHRVFPAPVPAECSTVPSGYSRERAPFALAWHEGLLYVGVTCTDAGSDPSGDHGFVFSFDPSSPTAPEYTQEAALDLNFSRYNYSFNWYIHPDTGETIFIGNEGYWSTVFKDWGDVTDTYPADPRCGTISSWEGNFNQPWLVDIEFDARPGRDDMVVGVRNRMMDMWHGSACVNGGHAIRLCETGEDTGVFVEETRGSGACADLTPSQRYTPPFDADAPWFFNDQMAEGRGLTGSLALQPNFSEMVAMAQGNIHRHMHAGPSWDGNRRRIPLPRLDVPRPTNQYGRRRVLEVQQLG